MSNTQLDVTDIADACRIVAGEFFGSDGRWLYDCYDLLNTKLFGGELPPALLTIELTPHGGCLGSTQSDDAFPRIKIHPSTFGGTQRANPWGVDSSHLGWRYACDVLIHEMIHASVKYRLGGETGPTSHNCNEWKMEVDRIAPLIGINGFRASRSTTKRVKTGELDSNGKPRSKVRRVVAGTLPFKCTYSFPHSARIHLGQSDFYVDGSLPFEVPFHE